MIKKNVVVAATTALIVSIAGGLAWACTPSRYLVLSPAFSEGSRARPVIVTGNDFVAGVPVEIRWNTVKGPELARAEGPDFSASIDMPPGAAPDTYYVVAVQRDPSVGVISKATAVFDIKAGSTRGGDPREGGGLGELWSGFDAAKGSPAQEALADAPAGGSGSEQTSTAPAIALLAVGLAGLLAVICIPVARKRSLGGNRAVRRKRGVKARGA